MRASPRNLSYGCKAQTCVKEVKISRSVLLKGSEHGWSSGNGNSSLAARLLTCGSPLTSVRVQEDSWFMILTLEMNTALTLIHVQKYCGEASAQLVPSWSATLLCHFCEIWSVVLKTRVLSLCVIPVDMVWYLCFTLQCRSKFNEVNYA
jgi:hypothetical protein